MFCMFFVPELNKMPPDAKVFLPEPFNWMKALMQEWNIPSHHEKLKSRFGASATDGHLDTMRQWPPCTLKLMISNGLHCNGFPLSVLWSWFDWQAEFKWSSKGDKGYWNEIKTDNLQGCFKLHHFDKYLTWIKLTQCSLQARDFSWVWHKYNLILELLHVNIFQIRQELKWRSENLSKLIFFSSI